MAELETEFMARRLLDMLCLNSRRVALVARPRLASEALVATQGRNKRPASECASLAR